MFSNKALRSGKAISVLVVLIGFVGASIGMPQERPGTNKENPKVRLLQQERLTTLRLIAKQLRTAYSQGDGKISFEQLWRSEQSVLNAELDLCESDPDRIAILVKGVAAAKDYEKLAAALNKAGAATPYAELQARVARLEAEIALERAKSKHSSQLK